MEQHFALKSIVTEIHVKNALEMDIFGASVTVQFAINLKNIFLQMLKILSSLCDRSVAAKSKNSITLINTI